MKASLVIRPVLSALISVLAASPAWAQATFGAEFNFSSSALSMGQSNGFTVNSEASESARDKMMKRVQAICNGCTVTTEQNAYGVDTHKVTYADGWWFMIATDPKVVEVQTKATTADDIEKMEKRIQTDIFDAAASVGLLPATKVFGTFWAGSHIHVGILSAFGKGVAAVKGLRNMMADFTNHSELATGIFSNDRMNAPALAMLPEKERLNFEKIAADVDSGKIASMNTFAKRVRKEVYDVTIAKIDPSTKYQAFNVNRIGAGDFDLDQQTFELRAMRGQESARDYVIQTRLIDSRLKMLASRKTPVTVQWSINASPEEKSKAFYKYVAETGWSAGV